MAKPRYMSVAGIIDQDEKEIHVLTFEDLKPEKSRIGLEGSPTKVKATFNKQYDSKRNVLEMTPDQAAVAVADILAEKHII